MISPTIIDLLAAYRKIDKQVKVTSDEPVIKVDDVVSKMAFFYEKVRNTIDYQEEHLLRRNAVIRILKRQILFENKGSNNETAESIIRELIRARYLPNNKIPKTVIGKVKILLDKYFLLIEYVNKHHKQRGEAKRLTEWVFNIAGSEIDELIVTPEKERVLAKCLHVTIGSQLSIKGGKVDEFEKDVQLYLAISDTLLKYDYLALEYLLFKIHYPLWYKSTAEQVKEVAKNLDSIIKKMRKDLDNPLREKLSHVSRQYAVMLNIFNTIMIEQKEDITDIISDQERLAGEISKACEHKYEEAKIKLRRSGARSIVYIFLTKILLAIILETPFDLWIFKTVSYLALGVNIFFPVFLMFLIAVIIQVPSEENTNRIIDGIRKMVYTDQDLIGIEIVKPKRRSVLNFLFTVIYLILFCISFGAIISLLLNIHFNFVSIIIFVVFLCLVSFFGIRIRRNAKEIFIDPPKEKASSLAVTFFTLPILRVGKWMSDNFSKINVFIFMFDFLIEAPFKTFVVIIEDLVAFIREKREELY